MVLQTDDRESIRIQIKSGSQPNKRHRHVHSIDPINLTVRALHTNQNKVSNKQHGNRNLPAVRVCDATIARLSAANAHRKRQIADADIKAPASADAHKRCAVLEWLRADVVAKRNTAQLAVLSGVFDTCAQSQSVVLGNGRKSW